MNATKTTECTCTLVPVGMVLRKDEGANPRNYMPINHEVRKLDEIKDWSAEPGHNTRFVAAKVVSSNRKDTIPDHNPYLSIGIDETGTEYNMAPTRHIQIFFPKGISPQYVDGLDAFMRETIRFAKGFIMNVALSKKARQMPVSEPTYYTSRYIYRHSITGLNYLTLHIPQEGKYDSDDAFRGIVRKRPDIRRF